MTTFKINAHTTEREMWARNDDILTHCERHFMRTDSQTWRFFENVDRRLQRARDRQVRLVCSRICSAAAATIPMAQPVSRCRIIPATLQS